MLMVREREPRWRTIERWATGVLLEEGAIKQCPEHGYMQCRGDPDARSRAFATASGAPPEGLSANQALASLQEVLGGIGDSCPEC